MVYNLTSFFLYKMTFHGCTIRQSCPDIMEERYRIDAKIGQGGLGAVYKGYDTRMKREVAIKRISVSSDDPSILEESTRQLIQEAGALASLQHPHIVTIYDVGSDEEGPYVVMELISGKTLDELVANAPLTWTDFRELALQTQEALIAAHELDIIHGDIKPSNLMLTWLPSGKFQIKIVDFGLATLPQTQTKEELEKMEFVYGSIFFMAPEQFERVPIDARADLYAMACVYYQALTRTFPFRGENAGDVINAHLQHQVTPIQNLRSDIPQWACDWIMWQLNRMPDDRPASALESLHTFLKNDKNRSSSQSRANATPPPRIDPRTKVRIPDATTKQQIQPAKQKNKNINIKIGIAAAVGISAILLGTLLYQSARKGSRDSTARQSGSEAELGNSDTGRLSNNSDSGDAEFPATPEVSDGSGILWDIGSLDNGNINATAEDFTAAGVTEDITGVAVANVIGTSDSGSTSTDEETGISLTLTDNASRSPFASRFDTSAYAGTAITKEYIVLTGRPSRLGGPILMRIGGLANHLTANTAYSFYLWGTGDLQGQNSTFEFNGETQVVSDADPTASDASDFMVKYTFSTGSIVADTLDFKWSMTADNRKRPSYAGFNGFAIVPAPEP